MKANPSSFRVLFLLLIASFVVTLTACSNSGTTPNTTSGPTARDLFYRANASGGGGSSGAPDSSGGVPAVGYCLELTRDGAEPVPCDNRFVFKSGDALRLHLKVNQPLYVYVLTTGSSGQKSLLYPPQGEDNRLEPGKECIIPPKGQMVFDDNAGTEHLTVGFFQQPVTEGKELDLKGESIDTRSLTGNPTTAGGLSVCQTLAPTTSWVSLYLVTVRST